MKFNCEQCGTRYSIADSKVERKILRIRCKVCDYIMTVRGSDIRAHESVGISVSLSDSAVLPSDHIEWYAAPKNSQIGPMTLDQMVAAIDRREIEADTLVWNSTMDNWVRADSVDDLAKHFEPSMPPRSMPPPLPGLGVGPPPTELESSSASDDPKVADLMDDTSDGLKPEAVDLISDAAPVDGGDTHQYAPEFGAQDKLENTAISPTDRDTEVSSSVPDTGEAGPTNSDEEPEPTALMSAGVLGGTDLYPAGPLPDSNAHTGEDGDHSADLVSSDLLESLDSFESIETLESSQGTPSQEEQPSDGELESDRSAGSQEDIDTRGPSEETATPSVELNISAPVDEAEFTLFGAGTQQASEQRPLGHAPLSPTSTDVSPPPRADGSKTSGLVIAAAITGIAAIGCIVWYASSSRKVTSAPSAITQTDKPVVTASTGTQAKPGKTTIVPVVDAGVIQPQIEIDASVPAVPDAEVKPVQKVKKTETKKPKKAKRRVAKKKASPKKTKLKATVRKPSSLFMGRHGPSSVLPAAKKKKKADAHESPNDGGSGLSMREIKDYLKKYSRSLNGCVQRQLKKGRLPVKRLTLTFKIRPNGRTSNVSIGKKHEDSVRVLSQCLKASVRRWIFPRFEGQPMDIEYPLILSASY